MSWENLRNLKKYREGFERLMIWDRRQKQRVWDMLSAQIQPNSAKLIGRCFTVQMANDPKHTGKQPRSFLRQKRNILQWSSQSPHPNPIKHVFHLLKTTWKAKKNHKQTTTEDWSQSLVPDSGSHCLQWTLYKWTQIEIVFRIMLIYLITFETLKIGDCT